jgi:uncharacterized membrane protein YcaP (DUF421 family)
MKAERITHEEILAALRASGAAMRDVAAVVLETDGTLSVVPGTDATTGPGTLDSVHLPDDAAV